jgi:hypothetical protein
MADHGDLEQLSRTTLRGNKTPRFPEFPASSRSFAADKEAEFHFLLHWKEEALRFPSGASPENLNVDTRWIVNFRVSLNLASAKAFHSQFNQFLIFCRKSRSTVGR